MNRSWYLYHGYQIGMNREETLTTRVGVFMDLMACDGIVHGHLDYKRPARRMSEDELMTVR